MAISTTLVSYILIFPALIKLRRDYPHVPRPFVVPCGDAALWIVGVVCTSRALLGSWVAVFPDTIEHLFGASYDFAPCGASRRCASRCSRSAPSRS